jgi:hypothetical protein
VPRTLEDLLLEEGLLDEAALRQVRRAARQSGASLVQAAVEHGHVDDERLAEVIARRTRLPRLRLADEPVDDDAIREVPYDLADGRRLVPLSIDRATSRKVIRVAMADPLDRDAIDEIEHSTGCFVEPSVVRVKEAADAVQRHYRGLITKMIPRGGAIAKVPEPPTKPHLKLPEDVPTEVKLRILVELLAERGLLDKDIYDESVRRLLQGVDE